MKVALITGGQQGIGLGVALALAPLGFRIALAADVPADSPAVVEALSAIGGGARYYRHDLRQLDRIDGLLHAVESDLGPITTLISNAGIPAVKRGDMLEIAPEAFDLVQDINLRGGFFLAQAVARRMLARDLLAAGAEDYRAMVFITSVSADMVSVERAEYCISKAGASMMARLFATRLAPYDIGVYELRPGIVETGMTAGVRDRYTALIEGGLVPAGRWGQAADVGSVVVPMVTGQMAFATGAVVAVDGGLSIARL